MHLMKECLFPFGVSFALQKSSPYTAKFVFRLIQSLHKQIRKLNWIAELSLLCNFNFIIFI